MAEKSGISWCDHTFNPWIGCTKVSPACDNCYAEAFADGRFGMVKWGQDQPRKRTSASNWHQPLKWDAEAQRLGIRYRVFCASLADVFDNQVPIEWRKDLFNLIASTPHLDWLLLTKRIGNARSMIEQILPDNMKSLPADHPLAWPWPHVWIGATVCNQEEADRDITKLLQVPAEKRFLSIEPMLGAINLEHACDIAEQAINEKLSVLRWHMSHRYGSVKLLDWVIVGGESGTNARPMHPNWVRSIRDECESTNVPFHFKQWGEFLPDDQNSHIPPTHDLSGSIRVGTKKAGRLLDGDLHDEFPKD